MTPERVASVVTRWVRLYTRDLPAPVAARRTDEISADLHDHIAHERAAGTDDRRIARELASRMLRGVAADAAWRGRQSKLARHSTREDRMKPRTPVAVSALRVATGVALVLSLPLVGSLLSDDVVWSVADYVVAGVLLTAIGVGFELAFRRAGNRLAAAGVVGLGIAAAVLGEADDAPGLVLIGLLLVAAGCAIGVRTAHRGTS